VPSDDFTCALTFLTMKGAVFPSQGVGPTVVDDLEKPSPGPDQVLVKSLWTAMNPMYVGHFLSPPDPLSSLASLVVSQFLAHLSDVKSAITDMPNSDGLMGNSGILVLDWPLVLGVDAGGVIVEAGENATSEYGLKPGDEVCGCTRLGTKGHSTAQEYFLLDANVTIPKPKNLSLAEAATLGVGAETACLALFEGLKIPLLDPAHLPEEKDEWVVILGGASSVGKFAIQLARVCGYKVVASCSSRSAEVVKELGATPFDYKTSVDQQLEDVLKITSGKYSRIFDAVAADDPVLAKALFKASSAPEKYFATTNDWAGIPDFEGGKTYWTQFGPVGRPEAKELNTSIAKYIPIIVVLVEAGKLKPSDYELIGPGGFGDAVKAYHYQQSGAGGSRKVVVKIQDK